MSVNPFIMCRLEIVNQGNVKLEFFWKVLMDPSSNSVNQNQGGITEICLLLG